MSYITKTVLIALMLLIPLYFLIKDLAKNIEWLLDHWND